MARTPQQSLRVLAAFYFLNFGGLGALFPFLPLLLSGRGLDPRQVSWVMVLIPTINLLMPPLWGTLADALQARLALLRVAAFGAGLAALLLLPPWGFAGSLLALGAFSIFRAPIPALADAATCAALEGREAAYGRVRVWGSVGFALFAFGLGQLHGSRSPQLLVSVTALIYLASGAVALLLPSAPLRRERGVLGEALAQVARAPMLLLLAGSAAYYFAHAIFDGFFSLHCQRLGLGDDFVGRAWGLAVAVEVLVMFTLPPLLEGRRPAPLLAGAAVVAGLRWHLLAVVRAPALLLALQALHGITFGLWYLALVQQVQRGAPERLRTSLQSISAGSLGLGSVTGYLVGGWLFARGGGPLAFEAAARGSLAALACYAALMLVEGRGRRGRAS